MATAKSCEHCHRAHRWYGPYDPESVLSECKLDDRLSRSMDSMDKEVQVEKKQTISLLESLIFRHFKDERTKVLIYDAIQSTRNA